ncbi:uncharacterized protein LOC124446636 [Xenia sp. Carnegie-2017]|uniref:uncharacterized protein LOC124446636 n=1 Tax=Xenia sp. Carnegie-2017 TaxID=2897299 RepID=UPI001F041099|nr:uncharacterized protein LOC124446636 [Xenia sp. Carnegie-2017]
MYFMWGSMFYFFQCVSFCLASENTILISSAHGNDTLCMRDNNRHQICRTLDFVLAVVSDASKFRTSTKIEILDDQIVEKNYNLNGFYNLTISGASKQVTIRCKPEIGFVFSSSKDVVLTNLTFLRCGSRKNATNNAAISYYAGLYFSNITNVDVTSCKVANSTGIGVALVNVGGMVAFSHTYFTGNIYRSENGSKVESGIAHVGGGLTIEFTYSKNDKAFAGKNNIYKFHNCSFINNGCNWNEKNASNPTEGNGENVIFGCGGGIAATFKSHSEGNVIQLIDCILRDNIADWGGGYYVLFEGKSFDNVAYFRNVSVESNYAALSGGGGRFSFLQCFNYMEVLSFKPNHFLQELCNYTSNSALWGGGVSVFGSSSYKMNNTHHKSLTFKHTHWVNNKATVASALGFLSKAIDMLKWEHTLGACIEIPYVIKLQNCELRENFVISNGKPHGQGIVGTAAMYVDEAPVQLIDVNFTSNNGTALVLDLSNMYIKRSVKFIKNNGSEGGALAMFGRSRIILGVNSHLHFTSNRASLRGGAIYAYSQGPNLKAFTGNLLVRSSCFFGYINTSVPPRRWSARVTFAKNSAPSKSGKSVYCDTLQFCRSYGNVKSALQWSPVFHYTKNTHEYDAEPEIMTDPVQMNTSKNHWSGFIGESISPKVTLLDEKGDETNGLLKMSVISSDNSSIHLGKRVSHYIYINDGKSSVPISFNGNSSKENFRVRLSAVYTQMMEITVDNVTTTSCYGGYTFNVNAGKCVCLPRSEMNYGYRRCGGDGETIYLKKGYWATRASNGALIVISCPVGYCHCRNMGYDSTNSIDECVITKFGSTTQQCIKSRTGQLCGSCVPGYSVVVGTNECRNCRGNLGVLWLLLALGILTIVVLAIIYFQIDFFSGPLNSWLYTYHIVNILPYHEKYMDPFIKLVISLTNGLFDLSTGRCIWKGMDNLQKLALQYIVPFYCFLLLYLIAKLLRRFPNLPLANRPFHQAFVTIAILSYSSLTNVTFSILYGVSIDGKWYVYKQGDVLYFSERHLPYAIPALLIFVFIVILFPTVIAFSSFFTTHFQCFRKFIPLFEAIKSPYRPSRSWFASYYIFCRLFFITMSIFRNYYEHTFFPFFEAVSIIVLLVFVLLRPYTDENYVYFKVDSCFLSLICVIACVANAIEVNEKKVDVESFEIIARVFVYLPLLYSFVLLVCYVRRCINARNVDGVGVFAPLI